MISVIVPVYNVEPYLASCLDSIISQTYRELEILLIDDGSQDESGKICDRYAASDERIRVFHTENKGLSAARNFGLDRAEGEYIAFVDSDDRIEPDMYETLLGALIETGADAAACGHFQESANGTVERSPKAAVLTGEQAVIALIKNELANAVWNKLWKRSCFDDVRFPEGRVYEEIATTYRVFAKAGSVCCIPECKYHYIYREKSISKTVSMANLENYWRAHKERYDYLRDKVQDDIKPLLEGCCAKAAARAWANCCDCPSREREEYSGFFAEVNDYMKQTVPLSGYRDWPFQLKVGAFFPHFSNPISFRTAWILRRLNKKTR